MKKIRLTAIFICAVVVIQGLALLFLTSEGLELVCSVPMRINAERFKPENNTYVVYYDARSEIADADLVVIGIDGNIAESYDLLGHFTRFLKQYNNFSDVMLDLNKTQSSVASKLMDEDEESHFYAKLTTLGESGGLTQDQLDYLSELYAVNATMTPVRKIDLMSYSSNEGMTTAEMITSAVSDVSRSALCVVDAKEFSSDSTLREELDALLPDKNIMYLETLYTKSCPSPETHDTVLFPFEADEPSVYFVNNKDFSSFYNYYGAVVGLFGADKSLDDRLDTRYTDYFFIVSRGTAAE